MTHGQTIHRFASILALASLVLASACTAATPPPSPTLAPTDPPTATRQPTQTPAPTFTATLEPTATATPEPQDVFQSHTGSLGLNSVALWDSQFRDPGAIIYHDGQFHMFYNGINGWPRPVGIGYATSADGYTWKVQAKEPVFSLGKMDFVGLYNGPNLFVTSGLVEADGTWVLYYYTIAGSSFTSRQSIGRATAPEPTGPWTADPEPVLEPGLTGAWDSKQVSSANVVKTETGYVMYYDGLGRTSMIGMATSTDGRQWTKYDDPFTTDPLYADSDPVLMPTSGNWDAKRAMDPNVVQTEDGWVMLYLTDGGPQKFSSTPIEIGYATSSDGIKWASAPEPVISSKNHPRWSGIYLVTALRVDGTYFVYFDLTTNGTATTVVLYTYDEELN